MREICTSGLMSGEGKRNASLCVTAPFLDSTADIKLRIGRCSASTLDRLVFTGLYRLAPGVLNALVIVKSETVIRWHRPGFARARSASLSTQHSMHENTAEVLVS
jgi:hypothetical protein